MADGVTTVRALYDAFASGDFEAAAQYIHPEAELRPALEPLEYIGVIRGRDEIKDFLQSLDLWESRSVEFEEVIEEGDRMLVVERWHVRTRDDMELDFRIVDVYTFRDGLIARVDGFRSKTDAVDAGWTRE